MAMLFAARCGTRERRVALSQNTLGGHSVRGCERQRVEAFPFAGARSHGIAIAFSLIALFEAAGSFAQSPSAAQQSVRFSVFAARPVADVSFTPRADAAAQKLAFYPTARSPRYEYRGAMPLRFFDDGGNAIAEAVIPPEIREALLLFLPIEGGAAASGLRYRVAVLDDSVARHRPGGLAIINLSGLPLSGTVNRDKVALKPGLNPTIAVGRSTRVMLRTDFKGKSYQSYTGSIELTARQRALLILFPPFYKGSLEVQSRMLLDDPAAKPR